MSEQRKILFLGSSRHASVIMEAVRSAGKDQIIGVLDDTVPIGTVRSGYTVLGGFRDTSNVCEQHDCSNVVLAFGDNHSRRRILAIMPQDLQYPSITHPSAIVSPSAAVGRGSVIFAGAHIGPNSRVGDFCILNTGSSMDHDCQMHDFSSIAPGVHTGGLVEIGECSHVGVGASISDRIRIGKHTVVGTGAVVVSDIPDLCVAYGNPARARRSRVEGEKYI